MLSPVSRKSRSVYTGTRQPTKHGVPCRTSVSILVALASARLCFSVILTYGFVAASETIDIGILKGICALAEARTYIELPGAQSIAPQIEKIRIVSAK
jgi:hypothetical protein